MLILAFLFVNGAFVVSSQPKGVGNPENITVHVIDSKTVEVFWSTSWGNVERYDVTYNPTENRIVSQAAGNSRSIVLRELRPNTQYQVTVTAVVGGKNYKSRRLVFRTSSDPNDNSDSKEKFSPTKATKTKKWHHESPEPINPDPTAVGSKNTPPTSTTVRGVEIGLVLLALCVWIIAIALFFHRWGKIRMLLPYQPDYKTQQSLKVPGTGTTIVSGCTGSSNSQGQQEGPGCVQHLRWSSRYSEDASTAKKCSPTRRQLRPRVSSAVFPSSPSYFYARTSAECESPRMIRHAHSHNDFAAESFPLCQVSQPRSDGSRKIISIAVSNVNEKEKSKNTEESKVSEPQKSLSGDEITDLNDSEFFSKDKLVNCPCLDREDSCKSHFFYFQNIYQKRRLEERKVSENLKENRHEPPEGSKDQPPTESEHPQLHRASKTSCQQSKSSQENEKPKRYNRSSLKKQKLRLQEDPDCYLNVPIYEFESDTFDKNESAKSRKSQNPKSAEMRRKAFLRKISLQDTYVNYNQDYWLDYKKSLKFHKSIDLGYLRDDEKARAEAGGETKTPDDQAQSFPKDFKEQTTENNRPRSSAVTRQSKPPSKVTSEDSLKKSDSDPVIFPSLCSCADCYGEQSLTDEFPNDSTARNKKADASCPKSFFLPSNDDIPFFLERNGLIETDFDIFDDVLDGRCFGNGSPNSASEHPEDTESCESEARAFGIVPDFSNFYEIKLNTSAESDSEKLTKPNAFDFQGGQAFFGTLPSTSEESDVFYNETDPLMVSDATRPKLPNFCSSSSPPQSNPDYN